MSMLAERKRKTKWVINPIKKPLWANDSSGLKFGKELMEKMGWSAGKGLGANEQGIQEPLKVSYKNDTKGMGFKGNDDQWIEHQDEFNILLDQLKADSSVSNTPEEEKNEVRSSLEEKSRKSRARLHYQKFMRGKDLSRYSENDLACILGTSKLSKKKPLIDEEIETKSNNNNIIETSFGVTTINSGSLLDYFKKKWIFDKKAPEEVSETDGGFGKRDENCDFLESLEVKDKNKSSKERKSEVCKSENFEEINNKTESEHKLKRKKNFDKYIVEDEPQQEEEDYIYIKKEEILKENEDSKVMKKRKKNYEVESFENGSAHGLVKKKKKLSEKYDYSNEDNANLEMCDKKTMRKKEKDTEDKGVEGESSPSLISEELGLEVECSKKKKKKKDKKEKLEDETEVQDTNYSNDSNSESTVRKKEKDAEDKGVEGEPSSSLITEELSLEVEYSKKKKRKKDKKEKLKDETEVQDTNYSNDSNSESTVRKKEKDAEDKGVEGEPSSSLITEEFPSLEVEYSKKKKRKKDKKEKLEDETEVQDTNYSNDSNSESVAVDVKEKSKKKKKEKFKNCDVKNTQYSVGQSTEGADLKSETELCIKSEGNRNVIKLTDNSDLPSYSQNHEVAELSFEKEFRKKKKKEKKKKHKDDKHIEDTFSKTPTHNYSCDGIEIDLKDDSIKKKKKKEKKKKHKDDENADTFSETLTHNNSVEINLKDDLVKKKKKKVEKEELNNMHCNSEIVGEAVESSFKVESRKEKNVDDKKNSNPNEVEETNKVSPGGNLNEITQDSGIQKHKFEFLNDKRVDKFYPGQNTNDRVQRLLYYVNFSDFKGSNLGSVTGYGYLLKCGTNIRHNNKN